MADMVIERKLTQNEVDKMIAPLERDLMSFFKTLQDAVFEMLADDTREPEVIIRDIEDFLNA